MRQPTEETRSVDALVCGGGPARMAAGVMAARLGACTLLVERYRRLGGIATQALVGPLMGSASSPFVAEAMERLGGRAVDWERLDLDHAELLRRRALGFSSTARPATR